ncbi:MAG TPA: cob(I)yrinic acid a,c-diamide adenosyltransferase [Tepidisphaeraceae bacterium]|nr:cob(I)yrinic acid a,c-diamide adenosyltransferase [Tepidisphaeraceae bacterium]
MKIYTKTGDDGTTGLIGGKRVSKSDARIECFGTIDELNAAIGLAAAAALDPSSMLDLLRAVQGDLFVIGSHLALPEGMAAPGYLPPIDEAIVSRLEMEIDEAETHLPALRNFILPGGSEMAARLHLARTICRRAERTLVYFAGERPVPAVILTYMNRLSDWLFVHARLANHRACVADVPWHGK